MPKGAPTVERGRGGPTTSAEVVRWRKRLEKEEKISKPSNDVAFEKVNRTGGMFKKNDYLYYYKHPEKEDTPFIEFTVDKVRDTVGFDAKAPYDTMYPAHERQKEGFKSSRPVLSSQKYGWYAPIDNPKYGFERTRICQESFMDKSHASSSFAS